MNSASFTCLNLYTTSCFVFHIFRMRFPSGISMLFMGCCETSLWDFVLLGGSFSCESSTLRVHALWYIICWWDVMLIGPLRDLLTRCHAFRPVVVYVSIEIFLIRFHALQLHTYLHFMLLGCSEISLCEFHICFLRLKRFREIWLWDVMILRSLWEVFVRFVAVCCVILSWDFLTIFYAISCFVRFPAF